MGEIDVEMLPLLLGRRITTSMATAATAGQKDVLNEGPHRKKKDVVFRNPHIMRDSWNPKPSTLKPAIPFLRPACIVSLKTLQDAV